jgi:hypothetical protein
VRRIFSRYLVLVGLLVNLFVAAFVIYWVSIKFAGTELYRDGRRFVYGSLDGVEVASVAPVESGTINHSLKALPEGAWFKIHELVGDSEEVFSRQVHGGAAFDPVRGRLMLFGSDTHSLNWDNSVRFFDLGDLRWSRAYPEDDPKTYRVNRRGIPVAGSGVERPWAMHTFDAVEFDPISDRLIVASHPEHMSPKKKWGVNDELWQEIQSHPTWAYSVSDGRWEPILEKGISFFPYGATFDLKRRAVIGVKPDGYWELAAGATEWKRLAKGAPYAYHNAAAYDHNRDIVVSFGTHERANDVWQFQRGQKSGRKMPTPGIRPPGADSPPFVYHPRVDRVVALVEHRDDGTLGSTETWLYSTEDDAWSRLETASLPFATGMNYDMVYDPNHELLVLVANAPGDPVSVWVLRIEAK